MGKGVLYKFSATGWSKSTCEKMNATTRTTGKIQHANASTWYDNFPMEQEYTQTFNCTWTQGYEGNTKLWAPTWKDHIYSGGNANFRSYVGFDKTAIQNFVTSAGQIQKVELVLKLTETSTNGSPTVHFYPHILSSAPASWSASSINTNYKTSKKFNNKNYGWHYIQLTANHVKRPTDGTFFNGITLMPNSATEWDWAIFSGKSVFNSMLTITVLK